MNLSGVGVGRGRKGEIGTTLPPAKYFSNKLNNNYFINREGSVGHFDGLHTQGPLAYFFYVLRLGRDIVYIIANYLLNMLYTSDHFYLSFVQSVETRSILVRF